ncbi:hypothetical protein SETIT_3G017900v2 [Setaria italica]|uniref:Uncharacterized protein n=1 Tax=Setaria italica TaxID=4555 RepID=A0A368QA98_SETIT|nr:hypothetical protein SETIT_3G017900v2 [Setaria italica]
MTLANITRQFAPQFSPGTKGIHACKKQDLLSNEFPEFSLNYPPETHKTPKFRARTHNSLEQAHQSTEFSTRAQEAAWFPWAFLNHQQVEPTEASPRARQFNSRGKRIAGSLHPSDTPPHEFTVQESLWKACPRTFLPFPSLPFPVRRGRGTRRPQFSPRRHRLHSETAEREREG